MNSLSNNDTHVLIAGAGPTGLTLACELRRRGVACRIIDKYAEFPIASRATNIHARTLEVFDDIDVVDSIIALAAKVVGATYLRGGRVVATTKVYSDPETYPDRPYYGEVLLNQAKVEKVLRDRLAALGGAVERSRELVGFREEENGIVATVAQAGTGETEQIRAAFLVGCDGAHSFVRKALGLTFAGEAYPDHWVLGDMQIDGDLPRDTIINWVNDEGLLAALPFPEPKLWRLGAIIYPDAAGEVPEASLELFQRLLVERAGDTRTRLSNPIWVANFRVHHRMVDHYRKGRSFVAGDAAHIHSPVGGQGMNTGIQDAYNLGWKLALVLQGKAAPGLLGTYEEERLPVARTVLNQTDASHRATISNHPVLRFVREHVLLPLLELPSVRDSVMYRDSELGINYRKSSLAVNQEAPLAQTTLLPNRESEQVSVVDKLGFHQAPHAGDRAPDARCRNARTNRPTTLFDEFRGPHFTLLLFGGAVHAADHERLVAIARHVDGLLSDEVKTRIVISTNHRPATQGREEAMLLDPESEAHKFYGASAPCLYLIRPDGYIGFRCQPISEEPLLQYLSGLLRR